MKLVARFGALVFLLIACGACPLDPIVIQDADTGFDAPATSYADLVIAWTEDGSPSTCGDSPQCPTSGVCADHATLGTPDDQTFTLEPGGNLEVAFYCSQILERGGVASSDFRVWATVPDGATAVVSVSLDGTRYDTLDVLESSALTFDLAAAAVDVARFVRITHSSGAPIEIDALQTL